MALTIEDLLAISRLLDMKPESKLQPIHDDICFLKLQNENDILPRLQNIEACYLSTFERYKGGIVQLDAIQADIGIMKKVLIGHSEKFRQFA